MEAETYEVFSDVSAHSPYTSFYTPRIRVFHNILGMTKGLNIYIDSTHNNAIGLYFPIYSQHVVPLYHLS
jgi:hypothetical protein